MELASCIASLSTQFFSPFFTPPGSKSQIKMSPNGREEMIESHQQAYRQSAVLILLYPGKNGQAHTVFIERNKYDGAHSGQISLPGGSYEENDQNLVQTAIRETQEEIGALVDDRNVLGQLSSVKIPVSGFEVMPIVAYSHEKPIFKKDTEEVNKIIEISIADLIDLPIKEDQFIASVGNYKIKAPYYPLKEHKLWGATAMIISEFRELFKK